MNSKKSKSNQFIDWNTLENPIYTRRFWSVKDACMGFRDDTFYLFFSAFYFDRWRTRSHVVGVKTKDWKHFSEPILFLDGKEGRWTGMCSPNITQIQDTYYLTFNSWGDKHKNGLKNSLFYLKSDDMEHWSDKTMVADNLLHGTRAIDIAVVYANDKFYLTWKDRTKERGDWARIGKCDRLDDDVQFVGKDGHMKFYNQNGEEPDMIHENFEFIKIDGKWHLLSTDYSPHQPVLYEMEGEGGKDEDWLTWVNGRTLNVPKEGFNTNHRANAAFLADWRGYDGYFYLLYAGRTHFLTHRGRGNNKLGLARSKDLVNWKVP